MDQHDRGGRLRWLWILLAGCLVVAERGGGGDEPVAPHWVLFRDRGLSGGEERAALAARLAELSPRARARRVRARGAAVTVDDLPPCEPCARAVAATGARIRARSRWLDAVSVEATRSQLERIERLPFVAEVRPVRGLAASGSGEGDAAGPPGENGRAEEQLAALGIPEMHECGLTGAGVVVGVMDTGFSLDHPVFADLDVVAERDFVQGDDETADEPGDAPGQHDHGTMVLSLLAGSLPDVFCGAAPDVSVLLAKIDDLAVDTPVEDDYWVAGLEWLEAEGADLVTSSIGYCAGGGECRPELLDGQTEPTTLAAVAAAERGLIVLSAAGNHGPAPTSVYAPADGDGVIAVGSVTLDGERALDCGRGPTFDGRTKPDVMGPGVGVTVADPSGEGYRTVNGTSFATPLVAGVVALLLQADPDLGPEEARALLTSTASQADAPDNDLGWGVVDGLAAAGLHCSCRDEDGDGAFDEGCGGDDCDDDDPSSHPGAAELCDDGADNDCDDAVDEEPCEAPPDGGPPGDGGPDGGPSEGEEGCACGAAGGGRAPPARLFLRALLGLGSGSGALGGYAVPCSAQ